ncbi:unnamed protein product [Amoebophrya sp. A25]|nr:unnamed protein product [Amoebophrya sp. A25]|eukprot:GSA25T00004926001.1
MTLVGAAGVDRCSAIADMFEHLFGPGTGTCSCASSSTLRRINHADYHDPTPGGHYSSGTSSSTSFLNTTAVTLKNTTKITSFLRFNKPFTDAEASSTYENGNNPMFGAKRALDPGGGYWVSDGQHTRDEIVSMQASLRHRHRANGVRVNWAYAPGMVRVRVSGDGKHFSDSMCWTKTASPDESFEEVLMFDRPRNIKAVRVDMKEPRAYKYFGINQMALK